MITDVKPEHFKRGNIEDEFICKKEHTFRNLVIYSFSLLIIIVGLALIFR